MEFKPGELVKIKYAILGIMDDKIGLIMKRIADRDNQMLYLVSCLDSKKSPELYHPMWLEKMQNEHET